MKIGLYIAGLSIFFNLILSVFKFIIGHIDGSVAITADAWHTLSDSVTSSIVFVALIISLKPADKEHPFGHGRSDLIASVIVGTLLAIVGVNFITIAIKDLFLHKSASFGIFAIIINIATIIVKEFLTQISIRTGKKINASSLIADGWHHRSDAISSIVIIAGILLNKYFWWIDGILGIFVSALILYTAYSIIKSSSNSLLGIAPSDEIVKNITEYLLKELPEIKNIHHFHLHDYGIHKELTFHIRVSNSMNISKAHKISTLAENKLREKFNIESTIHIEPIN